MKLLISDIEPLAQLKERVTAEEWQQSEPLGEQRRRERLSARALLRSYLAEHHPEEATKRIIYSECGAPKIENSELHISISHSANKVAVIVAHSRCGVDIERLERKYSAVKSRFCSDGEAEILGDDSLSLPIIWAAKEAIYKISEVAGLELLGGITIDNISEGKISAHTAYIENLSLTYSLDIEDHVVVWGSL